MAPAKRPLCKSSLTGYRERRRSSKRLDRPAIFCEGIPSSFFASPPRLKPVSKYAGDSPPMSRRSSGSGSDYSGPIARPICKPLCGRPSLAARLSFRIAIFIQPPPIRAPLPISDRKVCLLSLRTFLVPICSSFLMSMRRPPLRACRPGRATARSSKGLIAGVASETPTEKYCPRIRLSLMPLCRFKRWQVR